MQIDDNVRTRDGEQFGKLLSRVPQADPSDPPVWVLRFEDDTDASVRPESALVLVCPFCETDVDEDQCSCPICKEII